MQRDKARSGDAYALPRASFEQAGNSVVTIEPRTRPRIYYENLFNGVELAKCEMCDRPFTKNGNAQKFCGPDCAKAKKRADDNDRYRARKNSQIEKSLEA
ncbi:hypothetical protein SDC9_110477 [bioreactor metagenome]|uniref:Uncharacterized protein n=1 Tax=bioreactor metagenome TaxID=1076179 RepID=A0A645BER0_9ZZZZ